MTITFSTTQNQKNNINDNMTKIDLGECETLLRNFYNISSNETLYMKKIDVVQEGLKTPKVVYDVYSKLFGTNLIKLNLTVCENSKISIFTPFAIAENIDEYNSSSGYYNDICYTTTSEAGTDIPLKDRQTNYIDGDKIVCQEGCKFIKYDIQKSKATCSCNVEKTPLSISDMNINKTKLLDDFINIKNIANFNFLVCYKKLFCKNGLLNNIGSYIIFSIILFHMMTLIIFYKKKFHSLKKKIKKIKKIIFGKVIKEKIPTNNDQTNKMFFSKKNLNQIKKKLKRKKKAKRKDKINKINNNIMLCEEEINTLPYHLAINYDKRSYCELYVSLLQTQHNFINAFVNNNDYNSKIIKIDIFFIGFVIEYSVNALFFDDDTMHKIYKSNGAFDFKTHALIMFYSTLISSVLNKPINYFGLSNDDIISFKQSNSIINNGGIKRLKKRLSIKFILFFIFGFLLLSVLWYYISMFDAIYRNTQIHLLKDTLMSIGLSFLLPFVFYLLPGIFRRLALSDKKNNRKLLYDISKICANILCI